MLRLLLATRNRKSFLKLGYTMRTWGRSQDWAHKEGGPQVSRGHRVTKIYSSHLLSLWASTATHGSLVPTRHPHLGQSQGSERAQ